MNFSERRKTFALFGVFGYWKITNSSDSHHKFITCAWFMPHSCSSPTSHSHTVLSEHDHGRVLFFWFAFSSLTSKLFSPNSCLLLVQVTFPVCWGQLFIQVDRAGHKIIVLTLMMSGYLKESSRAFLEKSFAVGNSSGVMKSSAAPEWPF